MLRGAVASCSSGQCCCRILSLATAGRCTCVSVCQASAAVLYALDEQQTVIRHLLTTYSSRQYTYHSTAAQRRRAAGQRRAIH